MKNLEEEQYNPTDHLKDLRSWSDDIPDKVIHGTGHGNFKVRKNWWMGVIGDIDNLVGGGSLPKDLSNEAENFIKKFTDDSFSSRLTTAEDIAEANALIDKILEFEK